METTEIPIKAPKPLEEVVANVQGTGDKVTSLLPDIQENLNIIAYNHSRQKIALARALEAIRLTNAYWAQLAENLKRVTSNYSAPKPPEY